MTGLRRHDTCGSVWLLHVGLLILQLPQSVAKSSLRCPSRRPEGEPEVWASGSTFEKNATLIRSVMGLVLNTADESDRQRPSPAA